MRFLRRHPERGRRNRRECFPRKTPGIPCAYSRGCGLINDLFDSPLSTALRAGMPRIERTIEFYVNTLVRERKPGLVGVNAPIYSPSSAPEARTAAGGGAGSGAEWRERRGLEPRSGGNKGEIGRNRAIARALT